MVSPYNKLLQHSLLSKETTYELIEQYQSTTNVREKKGIVETLIKHNFKLLYKLAANFCNSHSGVELDDCVQVACLSLEKVISKFDVSLNYSFSTYTYYWVRSYLQRYWQAHSRAIRLPSYLHDTYSRIKKFTRQYSLENDGGVPSYSTIANSLELTEQKVREVLTCVKKTRSLNVIVPGKESENTELIAFIEDTTSDCPNEVLVRENLNECLDSLLSTLSPRDRRVIELRYGLNGKPPMSLQAVGDKFGFTRENARQLTNKALRQLRHLQQAQELKELYVGT